MSIDPDWLRAVIQQTVREMIPEIIQAVEGRVTEIPIDRDATLAALATIGGPPSPPATPDPST